MLSRQGVKRVDFGADHSFKVGVLKWTNATQLVFRANVDGALRARDVHDDQGIALHISLGTQHDFIFEAIKRRQRQSHHQAEGDQQTTHE